MPAIKASANIISVPCLSCGSAQQVLRGKESTHTLPIGVLHGSSVSDNAIIGEPIAHGAYSCMCGDSSRDHIHCIRCWTNILKNCPLPLSSTSHLAKATLENQAPEPVSWKQLVGKLRERIVYTDPHEVKPTPTCETVKSSRIPCECSSILKNVMLADDAHLAVERACRDRTETFERCTHRDVGKKTHPDLLPRSEARFFVHDKSAGKVGGVYEQWIGSAHLCRMRKCPLVVAELPYYVHVGIHLNYGLADKGYAAERTKLDEQQDTPLARFLLDYAHENSCHGVCYGDSSLARYSSCRIVEGALLAWMVDLDILGGACCGECDVDILTIGVAVAGDTVDRVRDELTGERFNLNAAAGRQNALARLLWEELVVGRPKGICCERAGRVCRAIRHLFVWTLCNPVYYTYRSAKESGLLEFVEAVNEVLMTNVTASPAGAAEEDDPKIVDDVVKRLVDTRLLDFLLYSCA